MALLDIFGFIIDQTLLYFILAVIGFLVGLVVIVWKRSGKDEGPTTEAWEIAASGATWPVPLTHENAAEIEYDISYSKGMKPEHRIVKHSHALNPVGTSQFVYLVPKGSTVALDPEKMFKEGQDQDQPEPLIQASASFYNRLAMLMAGAGLKLRENWFTILMIAGTCLGAGVILEAKFQLVPFG